MGQSFEKSCGELVTPGPNLRREQLRMGYQGSNSANSNEALMSHARLSQHDTRQSFSPIGGRHARAGPKTRWVASGVAVSPDPLELEGIAAHGCAARTGLRLGASQPGGACPQPLRAG